MRAWVEFAPGRVGPSNCRTTGVGRHGRLDESVFSTELSTDRVQAVSWPPLGISQRYVLWADGGYFLPLLSRRMHRSGRSAAKRFIFEQLDEMINGVGGEGAPGRIRMSSTSC